ncbi:hypothetical protein [Abditibacterium utsteinense]|nr:hypothetical protein [Abditibacterium utsteinense]
MRFLIGLVFCLLFAGQVRATEARQPQPRLFSNEDGRLSIKVVPIQKPANKWTTTATLLDLNPNENSRSGRLPVCRCAF